MGGNMEVMPSGDGKYQILFIDQGGEKVDVGNCLNDFEKIKKLGQGCFGCVYLVKSKKTNKLYAMKEILPKRYKNAAQSQQNQKEIKLLENMHHPHVITYFNSFVENDNLYIVIEYINGGSLEDLMEKYREKKEHIEEKRLWDFLVQALSGLLYLHQNKKIIHRDIKPDNIMIDTEDHLKISDFGISAQRTENADELVKCHNTHIGPVQFMSPEMELGEDYDFRSDIYMLGLTFFLIMCYELPFEKISLGPFKFTKRNEEAVLPDNYSNDLKEFVQKLMNQDPNKRPTTGDAYAEAITLYSFRYMKMTGMGSILQCFYSYPKIRNYFMGERIEKFLKELGEKRKTSITSSFRDALTEIDKNKMNAERLNIEFIKIRIILFLGKERFKGTAEVDLEKFIHFLLANIHNEINKKPIVRHSMLDEENDLSHKFKLDEDKQTDEKAVVDSVMSQFVNNYKSKISDYFCFISKGVEKCVDCGNVIKYFANLHMTFSLYPDRAAKHFGKKDINVHELFMHYEKTRLFGELEYNCKFCNKKITKVNRSKKLFTSPFSLIIELSYNSSAEVNLCIEEQIGLANFVEMNSLCKVNYKLTGVIFSEKKNNEIKYLSITRQDDNTWLLFEGDKISKCDFNSIKGRNRPRILFYSSI